MATLSTAARLAYALAGGEAEKVGSAEIATEHVFLGLCKTESMRDINAERAPDAKPADLEELRSEIVSFADGLAARGLDVVRARRRLRALWEEAHPKREAFTGHRTPDCREVFARAEAASSEPVALDDLMREVLRIPCALLDRLFQELGVSRKRLGSGAPEGPNPEAAAQAVDAAKPDAGARIPIPAPETPKAKDPVSQYGRDLTRLAREGKLHPAFGRDTEMKLIARILVRALKRNPMLVGDAGVGKTAIVEGLALRLVSGRVPKALRDLRIVELSLGSLVAGTKYRGEFEERIEQVIRQAESEPGLVLFIDEIHTILSAGGAEGGMNAANLLKPALARGALRCIGATTTAEYAKHIEKDPALARRFQLVRVDEPSPEAALVILEGVRPRLESHHGVKIARAALEKAVELSVRYLSDLRLPDKAIDLVDQACARRLLSSLSLGPRSGSVSAGSMSTREIGDTDVAAIVAERCRVPVERLTEDEAERLLRMEEILGRRVLGQEPAVRAVAEAIRTARAGLKDSRRPVGVFLFLGPTGTGKTELAKALAEFLFGDERHLVRVDMSEFAERHAVARLLGSPPGYVGHGEGTPFVERMRTNPWSVVLFDEIEKAHPDVWNVFLQIFDDGRLTDGMGRTVGFSESVIILTSNLGSRVAPAGKDAIGFAPKVAVAPGTDESFANQVRGAVAAALPPELRNRIQQEIVFRPLSRDVVERIIEKILARVNTDLASRSIRLGLDTSARNVLLEKGYSADFGARAMERTFRDLIETPLARMIVAGEVRAGQSVGAVAEAGAIQLFIVGF